MDSYNILVVDDRMSNLNAMERALRHEYNVFSATNAEDALDIMDQNDIALIIADHRMPGMTGIELLEKVRSKYPDTVRIILTAYTDEKLLMDAVNMAHAHGYLTKPWEPEEIRAVVRKWRVSEAARKKLETELLKVQNLESASILAGGIARDLGDILTTVLSNLHLAEMYVKAGEATDRTSASLAEAKKAALQARDLTQQLLTFSRGGAPIKRLTSIGRLLKDSASFALRHSEVTCEFSIPSDLWPVEIDEGQIGPVISNLIINADHAMPDGGAIKVRAENMTVDTAHGLPLQPGAYIRISVEDQGTGIPENHLQKIFNPYFTTKQKGSGLGLSTAYSIIRNHDGHITLESRVGVGTTFHIYLPASPSEQGSEDKPLEGKGKILVMDEEELIREFASDTLTNIGYELVVATNRDEAIKLYQDAKELGQPFDAVIVDLTMPDGVGSEEIIQTLVEIDPEVKTTISRGYSSDPTTGGLKKHAFNGIVAKPYIIEELSNVLRRAIADK